MTEIFVAKNSGVLRAPSGVLFRLVAGKTLADGRHEAVTGSPESWVPMAVELSVDGDADPQDEGPEAELLSNLLNDRDDLVAERDKLVQTLSAVVAAFDERGLLVDVDRDTEGWLVLAVGKVLDELAEPSPALVQQQAEALDYLPEDDEPEPVVVPAVADPETPEGRAAIREWAWANDVDVAERGTIPKAVVEQYRAAHA
jgi:hypothetical protein